MNNARIRLVMNSEFRRTSHAVPVALTIAGSDSGGGAGIQADLRTFAALRVFGTSAITLVTAQNTLGVTSVVPLSPSLVAAQIDAVMSDMGAAAVKTGALGTREIVDTVTGKIAEHNIGNLVIDPVMISKHGHSLIDPDAADVLVKKLFPLALLITPNAYEAAAILKRPVDALGNPQSVARELAGTGAKNVLLKGGHIGGEDMSTDYLFDGDSVIEINAPRLNTHHTHGTGCTLSAAITAFLARCFDVESAVKGAKLFISGALENAVQIGKGISPTHHMFEFYKWDEPEKGENQ